MNADAVAQMLMQSFPNGPSKVQRCVILTLKTKQLHYFFFHCQFLVSERENPNDNLYLIDPSIISFDSKSLFIALPHVLYEFNDKANSEVLLRTIYFIKSTKRFGKRLFD